MCCKNQDQDKGLCDTSGRVELVWGFSKFFTGQNQCKYTVHSCGVGCEERGGASPAMQGLTDHLLLLLTRVSACPIRPLNKCTFVWHNFSPEEFVFKLVKKFKKFVHNIFLNSYLCSHVCSQCHQSSSDALLSGCRNSGGVWGCRMTVQILV